MTPDRPMQFDARRGRFDRFAEMTAAFVSRAAFFAISLVVVVLWMPLIVVFESVDTWQLVINTATSVIAFLLIALLTNTELRSDDAVHHKLDKLAIAIAKLMETQDDERLRDALEQLRAAVKLEQET